MFFLFLHFKVVKTLMKKIIKAIKKNSHTDKVTDVNELDTIAETIQLVSPRYVVQ